MMKRFVAVALVFSLQALSSSAQAFNESCAGLLGLRAINIISFFMTPDPNGHKPFIDSIADPDTTLMEMSMYHLTDPKVVAAFDTRTAAGNFTGRLLLDRSNLKDDATLKIALHLASLPGMQVRASSDVFSITHTKSMRINKRIAFITTINLTKSAAVQRDYGFTTDDTEVGQEMDTVFDNDFNLGDPDLAKVAAEEKAKNGEEKLIPPDPKYTPPLSVANLLWSPVNSTAKIVALINYAESGTTLYASTENIRDAAVQTAFLQAVARGVNVRLLVPQVDMNPNPNYNLEAIYEMQNQKVNGKTVSVNARLMPGPTSAEDPYMHAKMIMSTGKQGTIIAIMSENDSVNSLQFARELGGMFFSPKIQKIIVGVFGQDWGKSVAPPPQTVTAKKASKRKILTVKRFD